MRLEATLASLVADSRLGAEVAAEILQRSFEPRSIHHETASEDAEFAVELMRRQGSMEHARALAARYARRARRDLESIALQPSAHTDLLFSLADYVIERDH